MSLDLRIPMGLMFTLVGLILSVYGLATRGSDIYLRSVGINANLDWGLVLLLFGILMFLMGRRGQKNLKMQTGKSPAGTGPRRGH